MFLLLEHPNPSKTCEKMGYFDRITVSLHILYAANQETESSQDRLTVWSWCFDSPISNDLLLLRFRSHSLLSPSDAVHSEPSQMVQISSLVYFFTQQFVPRSPFGLLVVKIYFGWCSNSCYTVYYATTVFLLLRFTLGDIVIVVIPFTTLLCYYGLLVVKIYFGWYSNSCYTVYYATTLLLSSCC